MRTIPTLLAAAAIAVGSAVFTVPVAHADYVCTTTWGSTISFVGNSNLCYGGGTLVGPAAPAPVAQRPAPQAPAPQSPPPQSPPPADHPFPPPPAAVSPGDCANPAFAASYNFYCADVGVPGATPAGAPAPAAPPAAPPQVAQNVPGGETGGGETYPGLYLGPAAPHRPSVPIP